MASRIRSAFTLIAVIIGGAITIGAAGDGVTNTGFLPRPDFGWAEFWLNRYQTLIGGGAALYAAWYAGRWVRRQIQHAREVEADRLARESYAARAVLPLALSSVSNYASDCLRALRGLTSPGVSILGSGG